MNSNARVMTVAATAPDLAPERARPKPTTSPTTTVIATAAAAATSGLSDTSSSPRGTSGTIRALRSTVVASSANAYPLMAANPMWPNDSTPVLPM